MPRNEEPVQFRLGEEIAAVSGKSQIMIGEEDEKLDETVRVDSRKRADSNRIAGDENDDDNDEGFELARDDSREEEEGGEFFFENPHFSQVSKKVEEPARAREELKEKAFSGEA